MTDLNQGASIEAECAVIERAIRFIESGSRTIIARDTMTDELRKLLVRRTPAAAPGAGDLPPLPKEAANIWYHRGLPNFDDMDNLKALDDGTGKAIPLYTAEQVEQIRRDIISFYERGAERIARKQEEILRQAHDLRQTVVDLLAQRKQASLQEIIDIGQEIEAGAAAPSDDAQGSLDVKDMAEARRLITQLRARNADLRAQLAAKGQGDPIYQQQCGELGGYWEDVSKADFDNPWNNVRIVYLAAPASAQPADLLAAARETLRMHDEVTGGQDYGYISPKLRAAVAAAESGAQPDQRESAAEGWVRVPVEPSDEMLKAGVRAFQSSYSSDDSLADWRWAYKATIAAAPSPAAKPAKEGEQLTNNKGEN
jgi:hypothetical protein